LPPPVTGTDPLLVQVEPADEPVVVEQDSEFPLALRSVPDVDVWICHVMVWPVAVRIFTCRFDRLVQLDGMMLNPHASLPLVPFSQAGLPLGDHCPPLKPRTVGLLNSVMLDASCRKLTP
jgi:hypothetical protein